MPISYPGVYPRGMSARGSGFPLLAGVIWPDEFKNGIRHALLFANSMPKGCPDSLKTDAEKLSSKGVPGCPVWPATDSDGENTDIFALPEGARLQLDPTINLDSFNLKPYEKIIAKAMQEYGMYLTDSGDTGIALYAIDPKSYLSDPYEGIFSSADYDAYGSVKLDGLKQFADKFKVIKWGEPPLDTRTLDMKIDVNGQYRWEKKAVENGCAVYG